MIDGVSYSMVVLCSTSWNVGGCWRRWCWKDCGIGCMMNKVVLGVVCRSYGVGCG